MSDSGHGEKLTRKKELAIAALLTEPTIGTAANSAGISEATLRRWMHLEEFGRAYRIARRESVSMAIARMQQASCEAVDVLSEVMRDKESPAPTRVSAARAVLELTLKAAETEDLSWRVNMLEDAIGIR